MAANLEAPGAPAERITSTASTIADYAYPYGHLGHLTQKQEEAFVQFKKVLEERGLLTPAHDDPLILYVFCFHPKTKLTNVIDDTCAHEDGMSRTLIPNLKRQKTGERQTT